MKKESKNVLPLLDGKKALVIDDMGAAAVIGKNMLMSLGANHVETSADYPSAFSKIVKRNYDIILCDFNLGMGLNGQQLLRDLRHINRLSYQTLFIVVSGERTHDIVLGTIECEPDGYIAKPYTQGDFKHRLTKLVEQQEIFKEFNQAQDDKAYDRAVELAKQIMIKLPKSRSLALRKTANMLYEQKRYEESLEMFNRALALRKEQTWAQIGRARCIAEMGQVDEAIEEFKSIISTSHLAVPAMDSLAVCYERKKQKREAFDMLMKSASLSPMSLDRQRWLSGLSLDVGEIDVSLKSCRMILKLAEGTLKESPHQHDLYAKTLRKAVSFTQDPKKKAELLEEGRNHLKLSLKKYADNEPAREHLKFNEAMFRSLEKFEQGKAEESIAIIDAALIRHKALLEEEPLLNIDVAEAKLYADDRAGAEQLLRDVMKRYPENKVLVERIQAIIDSPIPYHQRVIIAELNRKGRIDYEQGKFEDALSSFRKALEVYPQHPAINLNAVQVMLKMIEAGQRSNNGYREAKHYLDACVTLEPEHPEYERKEAFKRFLSKKVT